MTGANPDWPNELLDLEAALRRYEMEDITDNPGALDAVQGLEERIAELRAVEAAKPAPEAVEPLRDEREAFEKWCHSRQIPIEPYHDVDAYLNPEHDDLWDAWQARAALATNTQQAPEPEPERAVLAERVKELAYEMSREDVASVLSASGMRRQAYAEAKATAREFEAAVDALAAPARSEVAKPTPEAVEPLRAALQEIHNWLVCAAIASADDMAQSFEHMEQVASAALSHSAPETAPVEADGVSKDAADARRGRDDAIAQAVKQCIEFGRYGTNKPPAGHWLSEFWDYGAAMAPSGEPPAA